MTTNLYFNTLGHSGEQELIENLVTESIKIYGLDFVYLPRELVKFDALYTEDYLSKFEDEYSIEMYINSVEGFEGDGDFLSRFNLEIRDSMTLSVSRRRFENEFIDNAAITRPKEGDLVFLPLNGKIFEIMFVEHEPVFYQMGELQFYNLSVELFEYSSERFSTGLGDIDTIEEDHSLDIFKDAQLLTTEDEPLHTTNGDRLLIANDIDVLLETEQTAVSENDFFQQQANNIIDFSENNPFSEGDW